MQSSWVVVVPVKRLEVAKSRLDTHLGAVRRDLALAMVLDTVTVAASCPGVRVVVVTDDEVVTDAVHAAQRMDGDPIAIAARGAPVQVVADEPRAGINAALVHGAHAANTRDGEGVAAVSGDLPSLRASELSLALQRASSHARSFVADVEGTGTTLYAATSRQLFEPRFGVASAAAHARTAVALESYDLPGLRRDVDTIEDLRAAIELGIRARTATVVTAAVHGLGAAGLLAIRPAS